MDGVFGTHNAARRAGPGIRTVPISDSAIRIVTIYLHHFNTARPHRTLRQLAPTQADTQPPSAINLADYQVRRRPILDGLTSEYQIAAWSNCAPQTCRSSPKFHIRAPQERGLNLVRTLNGHTAELKHSIRDDCGERGQRWYEALEERIQDVRSNERRRPQPG
jgi:hypothetical protein